MDFSSNFLYNTNIKHRFYRKVIFYKWLYARSVACKWKTSWNPVWYIIFRWLVQKDWKTCNRFSWKIKKYSAPKKLQILSWISYKSAVYYNWKHKNERTGKKRKFFILGKIWWKPHSSEICNELDNYGKRFGQINKIIINIESERILWITS